MYNKPKPSPLWQRLCAVCGTEMGRPVHTQWIMEAQQHLTGHPWCCDAVAAEVAAAYRQARADQPGPDGRTWGQAVAAMAGELLAAPDAQRAR